MRTPDPSAATVDLVELGDIEELVRYIDRLCDVEEWDEVEAVRALSRKALERGRQLWPVASRAEYRLALSAPGPWAAAVLRPGAGRFTLGPLPEVVASTHGWHEVAPHLPTTPEAACVAYERVARGEDLTGDDRADSGLFEVPLVLQPWEPAYPTAQYHPDRAEFPLQPVAGYEELACRPGTSTADPVATDALASLARVWAAESNGRAEALAVRGDALAALGAFGLRRVRLAPLTPSDALARMAWTAASGGAHGRRRGMAAGRFDAWWALAAVAGLVEDWPVHPDELGEAALELEWFAWDTGVPDAGWSLHLAVHDPADGLSWALACVDERAV